MCEKPMAINSAEAKKMLDAAKRTGKKLTIGYQSRFRPDMPVPEEGHARTAIWATSTTPARRPSAAAPCPPGACSWMRKTRAAAR